MPAKQGLKPLHMLLHKRAMQCYFRLESMPACLVFQALPLTEWLQCQWDACKKASDTSYLVVLRRVACGCMQAG